MNTHITIRLETPPADIILMIRAGLHGVESTKMRRDAERSHAAIGILGISVQSSLPGEILHDAWGRSRVLHGREWIWWTTAGRVHRAGFPILPTGQDKRHYTIVLAHVEPFLISRLGRQFVLEAR